MKNEDVDQDWRFERCRHQDDGDCCNGDPGREQAISEMAPVRSSTTDATQTLLVTIEEAARLLGIGRTTMFELIGRGEVKSVRLGRRRLITRRSLESFVEELSID
jgi:excisionase family DNA binding protein